MAGGLKRFLDFIGYGTGAPTGSSGTPAVAGMRLFDFVGYPAGSTSTMLPPPPGIVGGTPLIFDYQQVGFLAYQSFFPDYAYAYAPNNNVSETITIACAGLGDTIDLQGQLDKDEGILVCCDD